MLKATANPTNLREAIRYFEDPDRAFQFVVQLRWPNGARCVHCGFDQVSFLKTRRIFKCKACKRQFSAKLGTIFEDSPLGLEKWLPALWMLANCKNGISSYELARSLGITQKSAWFMLHRIRTAMGSKYFPKYEGMCEVDETFIGGLAKNMHKGKGSRHERIIKSGMKGKQVVVGTLQRKGTRGHSRVTLKHIRNVQMGSLDKHVRRTVAEGATVFTDEHVGYSSLRDRYAHEQVNHAVQYVRDKVIHTNSLENFWSLLKRTIKGTYVSVDPFHLFRYLDEQAFRFNERIGKDGDRFLYLAQRIIGRRLDWKTLTGANLSPGTT